MFHAHLNPYMANELARARIAELEASIAKDAPTRKARGARSRRRRQLPRWTGWPLARLRPGQR